MIKQFELEWLHVMNAPPPKFAVAVDGLWFDFDPDASQKDAYACYFDALYDRTSGFIRLAFSKGANQAQSAIRG